MNEAIESGSAVCKNLMHDVELVILCFAHVLLPLSFRKRKKTNVDMARM